MKSWCDHPANRWMNFMSYEEFKKRKELFRVFVQVMIGLHRIDKEKISHGP